MVEAGNDSQDDRRQHPRHHLALPWPAAAEINGRKIDADIIDISKMGAKFRCKDLSIQTDFVPGKVTSWSIIMPSGSTVSARTSARWLHRFPEGYILGANFADQSSSQIVEELRRLNHPQTTEQTA
jgi:hypothetical protein